MHNLQEIHKFQRAIPQTGGGGGNGGGGGRMYKLSCRYNEVQERVTKTIFSHLISKLAYKYIISPHVV